MIHATKAGLVAEALNEYVAIARLCISSKKDNGGCFGFPAALLLLSCVDAIGAFYRRREGFTVTIDGSPAKIDGDSKHFYILNSHLFNLGLTSKQINDIYSDYRCLLVHSAAIKGGVFLAIDSSDGSPFRLAQDGSVEAIFLNPFHKVVANAVSAFLAEGDGAIENSRQAKAI